MTQRNPHLQIPLKEDSAAKLEQMANKPAKFFLRAPEFNAVVRKINFIIDSHNVSQASIDAIVASGTEIPLGEINDDFISFINNSEFQFDFSTAGTIFVTFTTDEIKYVFVFIGEPGIYGVNGLQATEDTFELLYDGSTPQAEVTYRATLNFAGDAPPSISAILKNEIPGMEIIRLDTGTYKLFAPGLFSTGKVWFNLISPIWYVRINYTFDPASNSIVFVTMNGSNMVFDADLETAQIEITKHI
jgi:hypothetical protein